MVSYSLIVAKTVRKVLGDIYAILNDTSFRDTCKFTPAENLFSFLEVKYFASLMESLFLMRYIQLSAFQMHLSKEKQF